MQVLHTALAISPNQPAHVGPNQMNGQGQPCPTPGNSGRWAPSTPVCLSTAITTRAVVYCCPQKAAAGESSGRHGRDVIS